MNLAIPFGAEKCLKCRSYLGELLQPLEAFLVYYSK